MLFGGGHLNSTKEKKISQNNSTLARVSPHAVDAHLVDKSEVGRKRGVVVSRLSS